MSVLITLRRNPLAEAALGDTERSALLGRISATAQRRLTRHPSIGRQLAYHALRRRAAALHRLDDAADATERAQHFLARAIDDAGGRVAARNVLANTITATLPSSTLARLSARSDVQSITPAPVRRHQALIDATTSIGAPSFWSAGYSGGAGSSDNGPVDLAIWGDKIQEDHPAFAGISFQRPPGVGVGTACGSSAGSCDHGTAVASVAISRGAAGCAQCVADDAIQKGVAPGLHSVLDAATDGTPLPSGFDMVSWEHGITSGGIPGASYPAQIVSDSHGGDTTTDDSAEIQDTDALISEYGGLQTEPAGNSGPSAQTLTDTCIAYDSLCMGAFDAGTSPSDSADDTMLDFSSRGPSPGGRKKPDLVGIGDPTYANRLWWISGNPLWDAHLTGTSFASPQAAGAAALLAGSGVTDPLAEKAILIDSARPGRSAPANPMGTQVGWQPDFGWGELDLTDALAQRTNFASDTVPGNSARFYRATAAPGDRATLVWNRRGVLCRQPGCTPNMLTLTNLDLEQLDPTTGAVEAQSDSTMDNVEQVHSPSSVPAIYKVKATSSVVGLPGEPYALAATNTLTPLVTPQPTVRVTTSATQLRPGQTATITATAQNPSPDLTGENASLSLDLPAGLELVSGSQTQSEGTLAQKGQTGDSATSTWTVRADSDTSSNLTVTASASRYGETFTSQAQQLIVVDDVQRSIAPPAPPAQAGANPPSPPPAEGDGYGSKAPTPRLALTVSRVTRRRFRLVIKGSLNRAAASPITLTYKARVGHKSYRARARVLPYRGFFAASMRLSRAAMRARGGALVAMYVGDAIFMRQIARLTVRLR